MPPSSTRISDVNTTTGNTINTPNDANTEDPNRVSNSSGGGGDRAGSGGTGRDRGTGTGTDSGSGWANQPHNRLGVDVLLDAAAGAVQRDPGVMSAALKVK